MLVTKILRADEWATLDADGRFTGSADDARDGFIHLSTPEQVLGTLARHFSGESGLIFVTLDTEMLGIALRWDPARGGDLFPHLYRALKRDDIVAVGTEPPAF